MFILFIFTVKILFVLLAAIHLFKILGKKKGTKMDETIVYWKDRLEFIFIVSMAILAMILFNPFNKKPIIMDSHSQFLFFVFGIIIFISADWNTFMGLPKKGNQSKWIKQAQYLVGR